MPLDLLNPIIVEGGSPGFSADRGFEFKSPLLRLSGRTVVTRSNVCVAQSSSDLAAFIFPPTRVHSEPVALIDSPRLLLQILHALDQWALKNGDSKSFVLGARKTLISYVKLVEVGWINEYYRLEDWTQEFCESLRASFIAGGWWSVLKIEERINAEYLRPNSDANLLSNPQRMISTNLSLHRIRRNKEGRQWKLSHPAPARVTVTDFLSSANTFLGPLLSSGRPFLRTQAGMRNLRINRSSTLRPATLAEFMAKSLQFVLAVREPLTRVFEELGSNSGVLGARPSRPEEWEPILQSCQATESLNIAVGRRIRIFPERNCPDTIGLYTVWDAFVASSAYLLMFMNARRRDEVIHRKVGLFSGHGRTVEADLALHTMDFYIEKTARQRVTLFVNELSIRIFCWLDELAKISCRLIARPDSGSVEDGYSIFRVGDIRTGVLRNFGAHRVSTRTSTLAHLREAAPASVRPIEYRAMRRAYALLFYYRYSNATLASLSFQLVHFSEQRTHNYITNNRNSDLELRDSLAEEDPIIAAALGRDRVALGKEMAKVEIERTVEVVLDALAPGDIFVGGFAKLVKRFSARWMRDSDFSRLSAARRASAIAGSLRKRGHAPFPMSHGDCWRGSSQSGLKGRCQETADTRPRREKASPGVCNGCPFQTAQAQHTENLRVEESVLSRRLELMPKQSLQWESATRELATLRRVIEIRMCRE